VNLNDWFGASKVVLPNGKPRALYHGTWKSFSEFIVPGTGIYFTDSLRAAKAYGEVIRVYLSLQNPLILDFEGSSDIGEDEDILAEVEFAKEEGFDGLIVYNSFDGENNLNQFVAFSQSQIHVIR
jgi:hypothetical protein